MKMTYSLGCNFDPNLIDIVHSLDKNNQITSFFGKLREDIVGGGRASNVLPDISFRQLENYIESCSKNNLGFNYLLNPMCLGNREISPKEHKKIVDFIGRLYEINVRHVTINSPYLCELIKKQFPDMKITIGLYAYIYSLQHIKHWINLGADELTLHHRLNRDFNSLKNILRATKSDNIALRLIANNVCLHDCPYQINHGNGQSHASQEKDQKKAFYLDYNLLRCNRAKILSPGALLASEWIRPEDVHYYSALCEETGNYNFSIKLLERTKTTKFLERVVSAYLSEQYDGNLIDILTWPTSKNTQTVNKGSLFLKAATGQYNIADLQKYAKNFELPNIFIDNTLLDGFLDPFIANYQCNNLYCGANIGCTARKDDSTCYYCTKWADKIVSYDDKEREKWLQQSNEVLESLTSSSMFNGNSKKQN